MPTFDLVRVNVPSEFNDLIKLTATHVGQTPRQVWQTVIDEVWHGLKTGRPTVFPVAIQRALQLADAVGSEAAKTADPSDLLFKLHRNEKLKSGYVGVVVLGRGFQAEGRDPQTRQLVRIGQVTANPTDAAIARYNHYKTNDWPYGRIADDMAALREIYSEADRDDDFIKRLAIWQAAHEHKQPYEDLTDEEREVERQLSPAQQWNDEVNRQSREQMDARKKIERNKNKMMVDGVIMLWDEGQAAIKAGGRLGFKLIDGNPHKLVDGKMVRVKANGSPYVTDEAASA